MSDGFALVELPSARKGFTLIELLVVIAIIALLASLLLPTLQRAKETGRRAVCISNLRQVALMFRAYSDDYNEYFPPVQWGSCQMFAACNDCIDQNKTWGGWMDQYIPSATRKILRCPSRDPQIETAGHWIYQDQYGVPWTTYFFVAGTGNQTPSTTVINGRQIFDPLSSTPTTPRAVCTRRLYCGTSVTGYGTPSDHFGPYYVQPESAQPLATDMFDPNDGQWVAYAYTGGPFLRGNHVDGENIVYVDGHVEWKTTAQVQPRCRDYYNFAYW